MKKENFYKTKVVARGYECNSRNLFKKLKLVEFLKN